MSLKTLILAFLLCAAVSCTSEVPRKDLPYPLTSKSYGDPVKMVTIPLPAISTDPNEGITAGALAAMLVYDKKDDVRTLLAPQLNYNKNYGISGTIYGAIYPKPGRSLEINISQSQRRNYDYEMTLKDRGNFVHGVAMKAFLFHMKDGSARFFGFGSASPLEQQTNYADTETGFDVSAIIDVLPKFKIAAGERLKKVDIRPGAISSLPFILDRFTPQEVPGSTGFTTNAQRISLIYTTLDSNKAPTSGVYFSGTSEWSSKALGSTANFFHYSFEAEDYMPSSTKRFITIVRGVYNQTIGSDVPFLERSILGGEDTLRGYGRNRFIDKSYTLFNAEERIRLFTWQVFNVNANWELAPFIDLGAVSSSIYTLSAKEFKPCPGIGFRAIVPPYIVGRIDIGVGQEGPAVFVGLGYPFTF